jgi:hypothetical protein
MRPPRTLRRHGVRDVLDVELEDHELLAEILLLINLMVIASEATQPLSQAVIDACLRTPVSPGRAERAA